MIHDDFSELALEVYLNNSPLAVNVSFLRDVGSSNFRFKTHLEVPNRALHNSF